MNSTVQGRDNRNARGLATARSIERAAIELAGLHGVDHVTVDEICASVGISQRTFFNHFDTKEDALLGLALPTINEQRVREYLADATVGILTGALQLIELPAEEPALLGARFRVLSTSPALGRRQAERMAPVAGEIEKVVLLKLRSLDSGLDATELDSAARTITAIAGSVFLQLGDDILAGRWPSTTGPGDRLRALGPLWARML